MRYSLKQEDISQWVSVWRRHSNQEEVHRNEELEAASMDTSQEKCKEW